MIVAALAFLALLFVAVTASGLTRPRSLVDLVLTAALAAYALLIGVGFVLSALGAFDRRGWMVALIALAAGAAVVVGLRPASVTFGNFATARVSVLRLTHDPLVVAMLVVALTALGYELALALATPAAEGDALAYHLTRAAFWLQQHSIDAVAGSRDARIEESPPGAEIAIAFTMAAAGGTRLVGLVQWWSVLVATVAVFGIARRLGVDVRPAALAALCVPALPIVALQAPTALNDVVVGALVAVAVYFLLDPRTAGTGLACTATAALVATKLTSLVAIVVLGAVALVGNTGRRRLTRFAAVALGTLVGASWLVIAPTGYVGASIGTDSIGGVPTGFHGATGIIDVVGRGTRLLLQLFELPGAEGRDLLAFVAVGGAVALVAVTRPRRSRGPLLVAGISIAATALLIPVGDLLERVYRKAWFTLGQPRIGSIDSTRDSALAGATISWFGAIGLTVAISGVVLVISGRWWRERRTAAILAVAPLLWIAGFSVAVGYSQFEGRYMIGGFLLGLAAIAPVFSDRRATLWAIGVSATTLVLVFVHSIERPAGVRLLERRSPTPASTWTRPDSDAQGPVAGMPEAITFAQRRIPLEARLAIWSTPFPDDPAPSPVVLWSYPFFGDRLTRDVRLVQSISGAEAVGATWVILPRYVVTGCHTGWRRETDAGADFQAFRRDETMRCG